MLEVVGVYRTVFDYGVGHHIVIVDLDIQRNVLGSQDLLGNLQDLGVRRGGSGHGDGLTLQRVIIQAGVITIGGVLHHGYHSAGILLGDEIGNLLALQRGLQRQNLGSVLIAFLHRQNVAVSGSGALNGQRIRHGVQAGVDGVVAVDNGVVHILQLVGQLSGLGLHDLHVEGILHDVVLGGGDAGAVGQLDNAVLLQEQQRAGLIGGVVGDGDLNDGLCVAAVIGTAAAAGGQAQGQNQRQCQRCQLYEIVVLFHGVYLLFSSNVGFEVMT